MNRKQIANSYAAIPTTLLLVTCSLVTWVANETHVVGQIREQNSDTHGILTAQSDLSMNSNVPIDARQAAARAILVRNIESFNSHECEFVFSGWNRKLPIEERKNLLRPSTDVLFGFVRIPRAIDGQLNYEIIVLCGLFADEEEQAKVLLDTMAARQDFAKSIYLRVAVRVGLARTGNVTHEQRVQESLLGSHGELEQIVALNCAKQIPVLSLDATAKQLIEDRKMPLSARLLALQIRAVTGEPAGKHQELLLAGLRDEQIDFHLTPFSFSNDGTTCRFLSLWIILEHLDSFSEIDRRSIRNVIEKFPDSRTTVYEDLYAGRLLEQLDRD